MHKRKRIKRFNTVVIKKSYISGAFFVMIAITVLLISLILKTNFSDNQLQAIINCQLPMIGDSSKSLKETARDNVLKVINPKSVLAEALPMLDGDFFNMDDKPTSETEKDVETATIPLTQPEQLPKNTFPIKNSQTISKNLEIRNETTYQPDMNSLLYAPLSFNSPEILIVHTHASESYKMDNLNYYSEGDPDRTTDINYNVVRVGQELAQELSNYGFKVTHAEDINDYPSYNQSYNKTLEVINYYLKKNKNIQIVLDIHRDSIVKSDGTKLKFSSHINGEDVAQVMIVCGTNQAGLDNDTWQENLKFALKMQNYMEINFPGLARPLNLRQERFNTHATLGSMIIEVGTSGNTLDEALSSTKYLAKTIKEVLKPYS